MSSPLVLHLIFCQIVGDMFNKFHSVHARISADEREEMLDVRIHMIKNWSILKIWKYYFQLFKKEKLEPFKIVSKYLSLWM